MWYKVSECKTCELWAPENHVCPPLYEVRRKSSRFKWHRLYAVDEQHAIELYLESLYSNNSDMHGAVLTVYVRRPKKKRQEFAVKIRSTLTFDIAREVE